jgi:K+-transporting ATPase ATPase A chain
MFLLIFIAASLVFTYGTMAGSKRHGMAIFTAMLILCIIGLAASLYSEFSVNPNFKIAGIMEGKETRFGVANSVLWSTATTAASNGSVNCMHDSLTPLSAMVAMLNIMLGEVIFGGVGAGLYGIIMFIILTVFIAGLMVGRTPEYLGKKIEAFEVKMAILAVLAPCATILIFSAVACVTKSGIAGLCNAGPHGLSEILYAFSSAAGNNGSAFAGLNANTAFYNTLLALAMLIGRFAIIIPALAISGSMVMKKITPPSPGTFPTDSGTFVAMLISVILIVGALTFMPALTLGPVIEQFLMAAGKIF